MAGFPQASASEHVTTAKTVKLTGAEDYDIAANDDALAIASVSRLFPESGRTSGPSWLLTSRLGRIDQRRLISSDLQPRD